MFVADIEPALLEDWLRERYFTAEIDISSSGVENYIFGDLRRLLGISVDELDALPFRDSPSTGSQEVRDAVSAVIAPGRAEETVVTHGASEGIALAVSALVRPGDEVIVLKPAYQSLVSIAAAIGATCKEWALDPEDGFRPDLDRLASLLTPRTRLVVVNLPHNPTGVTFTAQEYEAFVDLMAGHPAYVLWDASMGDLTHGADPLPAPVNRLSRCIAVGTLSKGYGLPGLRVGWCVVPPEVVGPMVRIRDYTTLNTSPLSELIAAAVMRNHRRILGPRLRQARVNRALFLDWAEQEQDKILCTVPEGGVTAFPRFLRETDTRELCEELSSRHGVLTVPGDCFGYPRHVRIGFGGPTDELERGLKTISDVIGTRRS